MNERFDEIKKDLRLIAKINHVASKEMGKTWNRIQEQIKKLEEETKKNGESKKA